jgi:hypothetical protein
VSALEADMGETATRLPSSEELNRLEIRGSVLERRLTQARAAERFGRAVSNL